MFESFPMGKVCIICFCVAGVRVTSMLELYLVTAFLAVHFDLFVMLLFLKLDVGILRV